MSLIEHTADHCVCVVNGGGGGGDAIASLDLALGYAAGYAAAGGLGWC